MADEDNKPVTWSQGKFVEDENNKFMHESWKREQRRELPHYIVHNSTRRYLARAGLPEGAAEIVAALNLAEQVRTLSVTQASDEELGRLVREAVSQNAAKAG